MTYIPPTKSNWTGRVDGEQLRVHQFVEVPKTAHPMDLSGSFALLGFAVDQGVIRNKGRKGAGKGPEAFRKALANLPVLKEGFSLIDFGDIACDGERLEEAQEHFKERLKALFKAGSFPISIGGGHEIALPHFLSLAESKPKASIGIINFDAHLDIRAPLEGKLSTSGSSFFQIHDERKRNRRPFHYLCLGAERFGNTIDLWKRLKEFKGEAILAEEIGLQRVESDERLAAFMAKVDTIYLTICLDVFSSAFAPGVSAPSALGITPFDAVRLLRKVTETGKVKTFNIAELNPSFDIDDRTAKLAATLTMEIVSSLAP